MDPKTGLKELTREWIAMAEDVIVGNAERQLQLVEIRSVSRRTDSRHLINRIIT